MENQSDKMKEGNIVLEESIIHEKESQLYIENTKNLLDYIQDEARENIPQLDGNISPIGGAVPLFPLFPPHEEVWFDCDMCTWKFGLEESLLQHKTKKHKWKTSWV